jgi:hypothetical protein
LRVEALKNWPLSKGKSQIHKTVSLFAPQYMFVYHLETKLFIVTLNMYTTVK